VSQHEDRATRSPFPFTIAVALVAAVLAIALNTAYTTYAINSSRTSQLRQGIDVERKICTTLGHLAALRPPPGNPQTNPSRAYDQELHAALDGLGPDLGCP
jgi:hypothetical protein